MHYEHDQLQLVNIGFAWAVRGASLPTSRFAIRSQSIHGEPKLNRDSTHSRIVSSGTSSGCHLALSKPSCHWRLYRASSLQWLSAAHSIGNRIQKEHANEYNRQRHAEYEGMLRHALEINERLDLHLPQASPVLKSFFGAIVNMPTALSHQRRRHARPPRALRSADSDWRVRRQDACVHRWSGRVRTEALHFRP